MIVISVHKISVSVTQTVIAQVCNQRGGGCIRIIKLANEIAVVVIVTDGIISFFHGRMSPAPEETKCWSIIHGMKKQAL